MESDTAAARAKTLILQDEWLIALELVAIVEDRQHSPSGPARSVDQALALTARERPDAVLLDENLHGEVATPVAPALSRHAVPFTVASAHPTSVSGDARLARAHRVQKSATPLQIAAATDRMAAE